jgi:hypothetical protein
VGALALIPIGWEMWKASGPTAFHDRNPMFAAAAVFCLVAAPLSLLLLPPLWFELGDAIRIRTIYGLRTLAWSRVVDARFRTRRLFHVDIVLEIRGARRVVIPMPASVDRTEVMMHIEDRSPQICMS